MISNAIAGLLSGSAPIRGGASGHKGDDAGKTFRDVLAKGAENGSKPHIQSGDAETPATESKYSLLLAARWHGAIDDVGERQPADVDREDKQGLADILAKRGAGIDATNPGAPEEGGTADGGVIEDEAGPEAGDEGTGEGEMPAQSSPTAAASPAGSSPGHGDEKSE